MAHKTLLSILEEAESKLEDNSGTFPIGTRVFFTGHPEKGPGYYLGGQFDVIGLTAKDRKILGFGWTGLPQHLKGKESLINKLKIAYFWTTRGWGTLKLHKNKGNRP